MTSDHATGEELKENPSWFWEGVTRLVRAFHHPTADITVRRNIVFREAQFTPTFTVEVSMPLNEAPAPAGIPSLTQKAAALAALPHLTKTQALAISVLQGNDPVIAKALADFMMDSGIAYVEELKRLAVEEYKAECVFKEKKKLAEIMEAMRQQQAHSSMIQNFQFAPPTEERIRGEQFNTVIVDDHQVLDGEEEQ